MMTIGFVFLSVFLGLIGSIFPAITARRAPEVVASLAGGILGGLIVGANVVVPMVSPTWLLLIALAGFAGARLCIFLVYGRRD